MGTVISIHILLLLQGLVLLPLQLEDLSELPFGIYLIAPLADTVSTSVIQPLNRRR